MYGMTKEPTEAHHMKDELDKLRALHEAATPGPWYVRTLENFGFNVVHYFKGDKFDIRRVAKAGAEADAALIATMHANWLDLIAQAERANALEAALGVELERSALHAAERALILRDRDVNKIVQQRLERGKWVMGSVGYIHTHHALEQTGADQ